MRRRPVRRRMRERCLWLCVRGVAEVRHGVRTILLLLRELLLRSKVLRRMYHLRRCGIAARRLLLLLLLLPLLLLLQQPGTALPWPGNMCVCFWCMYIYV